MAHRYELEKYRKYGAGTNVLPVHNHPEEEEQQGYIKGKS